MKYDHRVKVDGKWFNAGVEVKSSTSDNSEPPKNEPPKNDDVKTPENTRGENNNTDNSEPPKNDDGEGDKPQFTRTEIQQMNKEQLIEVATSLGFDVNEDNKVADLKNMILGKLGI